MADDMGIVFDAGSARRIAESVRYEESMRSYARPRGPGAVGSREVQLCRITGAVSGGLYPAVITDWQESTSSWVDASRAIKVKPSASETLANGSRYAVLPVGESGSDPLYATLPAVGEGTVEVTGVDSGSGNPTTYTTSRLVFSYVDDPAIDVWYVSNTGTITTVAMVSASATEPGIVTTGSQHFAGFKFFDAGITVDVGFTSTGTALFYEDVHIDNGNPSGGGFGGGSTPYTAADDAGLMLGLGWVWWDFSETALVLTPPSVFAAQLEVSAVSSAICRIATSSTGANTSKFSVGRGATDYDGIDSTALGLTFKGGILTSDGGAGTPSNGQIFIGNGSGFTLTTLTAGNGISITNGSGSITIAAATQMSLTADGSGLKLSGDSATPGNNYFYGTDGTGSKGWYSTSVFATTQEQVEDWVGNMAASSDSIQRTYDDGAGTLTWNVVINSSISSIEISVSGLALDGDVLAPGNNYYYGTDGTGSKGWYSIPAGLSYVAAPTYSDDSGSVGDYSYDATYVYLCVATNTWKRWAFDAGFNPAPP